MGGGYVPIETWAIMVDKKGVESPCARLENSAAIILLMRGTRQCRQDGEHGHRESQKQMAKPRG